MFGDEADKEVKIASDNTIKNSLLNFETHINGLEKAVALFFPSIRHEMILRYRAETIAKIGVEAYKMAVSEGIQINPIPPKIALPLIEKMSLEHEPDMYGKWAKLLIATGVKSNPIQQQYADILANLNNENANFLKDIYTKQADPDLESKFDEYVDKSRFQDLYKEAESKAKKENAGVEEYSRGILSNMFFPSNRNFDFSLFIPGTEEKLIFTKKTIIFGNMVLSDERNDWCLVLTKEKNNMLLGLEKLGLIKYKEYRSGGMKQTKEGKDLYINHYGLLLTKFGYSFVDCLENPTK